MPRPKCKSPKQTGGIHLTCLSVSLDAVSCMNIKWKVLYKAYGFTPLQKKLGSCATAHSLRLEVISRRAHGARRTRRRDACVPHKIKRAKGDVKRGCIRLTESNSSACISHDAIHDIFHIASVTVRHMRVLPYADAGPSCDKAPYRRVCHKPYSTDRITLRSPHRLLYQSRCPQAAQLCARRRVVLLAVVLLRVV